MTRRRERLVRQLRQEGRLAYQADKHEQTNPHLPHGGPDWHQWMRGYKEAGQEERQ